MILAAFHIEQAFQLYLKYILAKELGYFPKMYSLSALFKGVSKIDGRFFEFYKDTTREYSKEEISKMMEVLNRFKEVFKKWIS
ncbi:HEPN domain-containing protein [Archaeoglobus sp.]